LTSKLHAPSPISRIPSECVRLRAHKLEQHIRQVVDSAPPLTADQIGRLRDLLPPCDAAGR
ncbi:hypothetical protein, partial [Streptomyces chiangmaiensis]|uniref:hypothetical protein n=1 Tax=Streptomyces chiangmaiensis TaxID=766497 RepID=UPI0031EE9206